MMEQQLYLAFDIGGTTIKYGIINSCGDFLEHGLILNRIRSAGVKAMLSDLGEKAKELTDKYALTAIGVSTSGVIDVTTGEILWAAPHFPDYGHCNPGQMLTAATGLPCCVDNDVNCAVLGEYYRGVAKGKSPMCCLAIGTGIGGATLIDGKLLYGKGYFAGEIGHFPVAGGELEYMASTSALVRRVAKAKNLPLEAVNGEKIFAWAKDSDKIAVDAIDVMVQALAQGLVYLIYAINPEVIVLGGAVAAQEEYLKPRIMEKLRAMVVPELLKDTEIAFSKLENKAGMLGAISKYLHS